MNCTTVRSATLLLACAALVTAYPRMGAAQTTYGLSINIDAAGVLAINQSGQKVTVVKSVSYSPSSSTAGKGNKPAGDDTSPPVVWLAFSPLETNDITWTEQYYIYATTTQITAGAQIQMTSATGGPVQEGWLYTFQNGVFDQGAQGTGTSYNTKNEGGGLFGMGLAQQATLNNAQTMAPLSVASVLNNEGASFTPSEKVSIYLSSVENNGSVTTRVTGDALTVTLKSASPSATIGFNDQTNTFYKVSDQKESKPLSQRLHASR